MGDADDAGGDAAGDAADVNSVNDNDNNDNAADQRPTSPAVPLPDPSLEELEHAVGALRRFDRAKGDSSLVELHARLDVATTLAGFLEERVEKHVQSFFSSGRG